MFLISCGVGIDWGIGCNGEVGIAAVGLCVGGRSPIGGIGRGVKDIAGAGRGVKVCSVLFSAFGFSEVLVC